MERRDLPERDVRDVDRRRGADRIEELPLPGGEPARIEQPGDDDVRVEEGFHASRSSGRIPRMASQASGGRMGAMMSPTILPVPRSRSCGGSVESSDGGWSWAT